MQPEASSQVEPEAGSQKSEVSGQTPAALGAGYRSTEFAITCGLLLCLVAGAARGLIPPDHAAGFSILVATIYKSLRVLLKLQAGQTRGEQLLALIDAQVGVVIDGDGGRAPAPAISNLQLPVLNSQSAGSSGASGEIEKCAVQSAKGEVPRHTEEPYPAPAVVRPPPPLAGAGSVIVLLCAALALGGCAGSKADTDFRSKVSRVDVGADGTYDEATKSGAAEAKASIYFRDPNQTGLGKGAARGKSGKQKAEKLMWTEDGWQVATPPRQGQGQLQIANSQLPICNFQSPHPAFHLTLPELRDAPGDMPESWLRTLYYGPRIVPPIWPDLTDTRPSLPAVEPRVILHTFAGR